MVIGMNAETGRAMGDDEHIRQSVRDILTTPLGSRVMRRDYGSVLPELIDQPATGANMLRLMAATAAAVDRWEPRLKLKRVMPSIQDMSGRVTIDLQGVRTDVPQAASFSVVL